MAARTVKALVAALLLLPVALVLGRLGYERYDVARVRKVCEEIRPGASLADIRLVLERRDLVGPSTLEVEEQRVRSGKPSDHPGVEVISQATMADFICGIEMADGRVTSTHMDEPR